MCRRKAFGLALVAVPCTAPASAFSLPGELTAQLGHPLETLQKLALQAQIEHPSTDSRRL